MNPLDIPSIVPIVLSHLDFGTLLSCRLVNPLWAEEATKLLPTRTKINIHPSPSPSGNLLDFMDLVKDEEYCKISLGCWKTFNLKLHTGIDDGKRVNHLIKLLGDKVNSVEISLDIGSQSTIWKILGRYAPKMEMVVINDSLNTKAGRNSGRVAGGIHKDFFLNKGVSIDSVKDLSLVQSKKKTPNNPSEEEEDPIIDELAALLLHILPNLETLTISRQNGDYSLFPTMLSELCTNSDFINPSKSLNHLKFHLNLNESEVLMMFEKFKFPLTRLDLSLRPGLRFQGLYDWLSSLGETLVSLNLDFVLVPQNPEIFPCGDHLLNLKHLGLKNYWGPLDFLKSMTQLKSLELTNVNLSLAFQEGKGRRCDKVESLVIINGHSNAGRISFSRIYKTIGEYFPNLKKFRGDYLLDSNLKVLVECCKYLEELYLPDSVVSDEGFGEMLGMHGTLGTNLKKIHISSPKVSDLTFQGFLTCLKLEEVCISSHLISFQAIQDVIISLKLKRLRVNTSRCYQISPEDCLNLSQVVQGTGTELILNGPCFGCGVSDDSKGISKGHLNVFDERL